MVNGREQFLFTIDHLLFTAFLVVLARALQRAALVAFAEFAARRPAALNGALVGAVAGATVGGQDAFDFGVGAGDDVDADEFPDSSGGGGPGVGRGLDRPHVAAHEDRDVAGADVLLAQELYVGGFDHRVRGLDGADEPLG